MKRTILLSAIFLLALGSNLWAQVDIAGKWVGTCVSSSSGRTYPAKADLTQSGNDVSGSITIFLTIINPPLELQGNVDGTVSGNDFTGTWKEKTGDCPDPTAFEYEISMDLNTMTGWLFVDCPDFGEITYEDFVLEREEPITSTTTTTAVYDVCEIAISPQSKSVLAGESIQFYATESGASCANPCYTWEVSSAGSTGNTIDANGLYIAGSTEGTDEVKVTDTCNGGISDIAIVEIVPCKLTISPEEKTVLLDETIQFSASSTGDCKSPCYTWEIMERVSTESTISVNGLYKAGGTLGTEIVTVTDTCNNNVSDTSIVSVIPTTTTTTTSIPPPVGGDPNPPIFPTPPPPCTSDDDCDDGIFCNGAEICSKEVCWGGSEPCPDDELFCNGEESCDEEDDACIHSGDPCAPDFTCDEDNDLCLGCSTDADCNDGVFCNGVETCQDEGCQPGSDPCLDDELFCNGEESCDEETDACLSAGNPCAPSEECDEGDDVCVPPPIPPLPPSFDLIPYSVVRSHLIPLPLFMFIASDDPDTKFTSTATASFSGDVITSPWTLVLSEDLIFTSSLINPAGLEATGSTAVEVTVTTDEGEGTATLTLNMLPFILDEKR